MEGDLLLRVARVAISERLGADPAAAPAEGDVPEGFRQPAATFVTLTKAGDLRGCIGSLEAYRPLLDDVRANAVAAAFHDPRFPPVTAGEFEQITVEVSLLSEPVPFPVAGEADAVARLHPGVDGVVLTHAAGRATYLPQVWEQLRDPREFLRSLKHKAGLPADGWRPDIRLATYAVQKWAEA